MPNPPSGTVTFLFTDIEGSTKLARQHPAEWELARDRHHAILRAACEARDGHVFQIIGDAFCVAFATATAGLQAAIAAQHALQTEAWGETPIRVRMGLHTGAAEATGSDYRGYLALAHVQRVMSTAYGGQTLVSSTAGALIAAQLPEGVTLRDMGEHRLKGLLNPERLWQVDAPGLAREFPPLQTLNAIPNNLPIQVTSFVGREAELAELEGLLPNTRLLTLTGSGGTGKTRLSLQLAAGVMDAYKDGVWLVELAPLTNPELVPNAVAAVLGVREQPGQTILSLLLNWVRSRQLLLILDNCEHLIEACARLADAILHAGRHARILASSREALGIAGEQAFHVPSLRIPAASTGAAPADLMAYDAVALFVQRACTVKRDFAITPSNAATVAQVCRRLDGIPLAIELAAARLRALSIDQIAQRLDDRFRLLTGGSRTALPRQQTLRSLIDWSYDLLSEPERAALRQFSVFAGGWSLEAAEAVCGSDALDLLSRLADKSLVTIDEQAGEPRYRLLETIRQYARERLFEAREAEGARDSHLSYFQALTGANEDRLEGRDMIAALDQLELEQGNLRAAMEWALETNLPVALHMMAVLSNFFGQRASTNEGRDWLRMALARAVAQPAMEGAAARDYKAARAMALWGAATLAFGSGENHTAIDLATQSIALAREIDAPRTLARALSVSGMASGMVGDVEATHAASGEALAIARRLGYLYVQMAAMAPLAMLAFFAGEGEAEAMHEALTSQARALGNPLVLALQIQNAGRLARMRGRYAEAYDRFEEAGQLFARLRSIHFEATNISEQAHLRRLQGRYAEAAALYRHTLRIWRDEGHRAAAAHELECFAFIAQAQGDLARAARLLGAAESLREISTAQMTTYERTDYDTHLAALRAAMDAGALNAAWAAGRAMNMDQAVAFAIEDYDGQPA